MMEFFASLTTMQLMMLVMALFIPPAYIFLLDGDRFSGDELIEKYPELQKSKDNFQLFSGIWYFFILILLFLILSHFKNQWLANPRNFLIGLICIFFVSIIIINSLCAAITGIYPLPSRARYTYSYKPDETKYRLIGLFHTIYCAIIILISVYLMIAG